MVSKGDQVSIAKEMNLAVSNEATMAVTLDFHIVRAGENLKLKSSEIVLSDEGAGVGSGEELCHLEISGLALR
jgi:hypothetical protein